MLVRAIS